MKNKKLKIKKTTIKNNLTWKLVKFFTTNGVSITTIAPSLALIFVFGNFNSPTKESSARYAFAVNESITAS